MWSGTFFGYLLSATSKSTHVVLNPIQVADADYADADYADADYADAKNKNILQLSMYIFQYVNMSIWELDSSIAKDLIHSKDP